MLELEKLLFCSYKSSNIFRQGSLICAESMESERFSETTLFTMIQCLLGSLYRSRINYRGRKGVFTVKKCGGHHLTKWSNLAPPVTGRADTVYFLM